MVSVIPQVVTALVMPRQNHDAGDSLNESFFTRDAEFRSSVKFD
jgi:hypothetical protein